MGGLRQGCRVLGAARGPFAVILAFVIFVAFQGYTASRDAAGLFRVGIEWVGHRHPVDDETVLVDAGRERQKHVGHSRAESVVLALGEQPVCRGVADRDSISLGLAIRDRAERRTWLEARDYRVLDMVVTDVERDLAAELDRLSQLLSAGV